MKKSLQHYPIRTLFNFLPPIKKIHLLPLPLLHQPLLDLIPLLRSPLLIFLQQPPPPALNQSQHFDYFPEPPITIFAGVIQPE